MAANEQYGSRWVEIQSGRMAAERVFVTEWDERFSAAGLPAYGSRFPMLPEPPLWLTGARYEPCGRMGSTAPNDEYTYCRITFTYTDTAMDSAFPVWSYTAGGRFLDIHKGRTWTSTGAACTSPVNILIPQLSVQVAMVVSNVPSAAKTLIGKLNDQMIDGCAIGTVLYVGYQAESQWDFSANDWRTKITYQFEYDSIGHNYMPDENGTLDTTSPLAYDSGDFSQLGIS